MLQCILVCCRVWQLEVFFCKKKTSQNRARMLRRVAGVLQCAAVCCSVLQCVAVRCSLRSFFVKAPRQSRARVLQHIALCYSVLQCVAVCCSVLQCATV